MKGEEAFASLRLALLQGITNIKTLSVKLHENPHQQQAWTDLLVLQLKNFLRTENVINPFCHAHPDLGQVLNSRSKMHGS